MQELRSTSYYRPIIHLESSIPRLDKHVLTNRTNPVYFGTRLTLRRARTLIELCAKYGFRGNPLPPP